LDGTEASAVFGASTGAADDCGAGGAGAAAGADGAAGVGGGGGGIGAGAAAGGAGWGAAAGVVASLTDTSGFGFGLKAGISDTAGFGIVGWTSCAYGTPLVKGEMLLTVEQPTSAPTMATVAATGKNFVKRLFDVMANPYGLTHL
jgi:hypothetical protein